MVWDYVMSLSSIAYNASPSTSLSFLPPSSFLPLSFFLFPLTLPSLLSLSSPPSSPSPSPHPLLFSHYLCLCLYCQPFLLLSYSALNTSCILSIIRFSISFFLSTDAALSVRGLDIYCTLSAYHLSSYILSYLLLSSASFFFLFTAILTSLLYFLSFSSLLSTFLFSYTSIHFCSSFHPSLPLTLPPSLLPPPIHFHPYLHLYLRSQQFILCRIIKFASPDLYHPSADLTDWPTGRPLWTIWQHTSIQHTPSQHNTTHNNTTQTLQHTQHNPMY